MTYISHFASLFNIAVDNFLYLKHVRTPLFPTCTFSFVDFWDAIWVISWLIWAECGISKCCINFVSNWWVIEAFFNRSVCMSKDFGLRSQLRLIVNLVRYKHRSWKEGRYLNMYEFPFPHVGMEMIACGT